MRPLVFVLGLLLCAAPARAAAPYHPDPQHPYNRVFAALFPGMEDASLLLQPKDLRFLADRARRQAAEQALRGARSLPPQTSPVSALLLQSDLWERFDALPPDDPLRAEIGKTVAHLALPAKALAQVPPNLPELVRSHPALLSQLDRGTGWVEVVARSKELPESLPGEAKDGTRHAANDGFRSVFRRFVWVPPAAGGADWLRLQLQPQPASLELPPGTRLVLTQTPLVITPKGELVPAPLTTLVEGRIVAPATTTALVFHTLEERRALLRANPRPEGGLVALAPQALIPMGGTCHPGDAAKLDMRTVCMSCHGPSGHRLTGNMSHGPPQLRVADSADLLGRLSIAEKQRRPEWSALRRWL